MKIGGPWTRSIDRVHSKWSMDLVQKGGGGWGSMFCPCPIIYTIKQTMRAGEISNVLLISKTLFSKGFNNACLNIILIKK